MRGQRFDTRLDMKTSLMIPDGMVLESILFEYCIHVYFNSVDTTVPITLLYRELTLY